MPLSDAQIRTLKAGGRPTKHSDGGGLHLVVNPTGSKLWRMAYRFEGRQKLLSFGAYPAVSLAQAWSRRDVAKALLAKAVDPAEQAKLDRVARATAIAITFNALADELLVKAEREGKAETTLVKKRWLLDIARSDLGRRPIRDITAAEVLVPLRRVEAEGNYETARRLRATIGQVFRLAVATARADNDPTFALKGALTTPTVSHHAAVTTWAGFGGLVRAIWDYDGMPDTRAAMQLMALLYPRPGELRHADWSEFDLAKATWTIPASRAKMRREHRKPLPADAVALLDEVATRTRSGRLVFPAIHTTLRPMSENTLNTALRRMGFGRDEATSHGFRATASTLLNESGLWHADAIEAELGHVGADEVRRAYHRAAYWEERKRMAEWWASEVGRFASVSRDNPDV